MPRHSHRPRKQPRPSRLPVDLIHWRDPDNNERSLCNAEERATYTGETVIASIVEAEVTCADCKRVMYGMQDKPPQQPTAERLLLYLVNPVKYAIPEIDSTLDVDVHAKLIAYARGILQRAGVLR